jgi:hypothetical protein
VSFVQRITVPIAQAAAHPSDWLDLKEAAALLRMTPSGVRSLGHRGLLRPDGRGSRRIAMFRRATLDAFLEGRYDDPHARSGCSVWR